MWKCTDHLNDRTGDEADSKAVEPSGGCDYTFGDLGCTVRGDRNEKPALVGQAHDLWWRDGAALKAAA